MPISTPGFDAAPYLTATLCVTRDPETGVRNMGTYRAALKATDRLGVRMASRLGGAGGYLHWCKYRDRKEPMPCAIVIGAAPVVVYTGPQKFPTNVDEVEVAGGLAGQPIRMAKCVSIDLEVPADSEIVIEGLIDPELLEPEGPSPIFEPGDALFFDELFLHQTGSDPAMPKPRYALESWFFGASRFPSAYAPIAVR